MRHMLNKLPLEDGEQIDIRSAGAMSVAPSGRWRLGEWCKTNKKLLFLQGGDVRFFTGLNSLLEIELVEREYSFGKRQCLKIDCYGRESEEIFWLMLPNVKLWQEKLSKYVGSTVAEGDIIKLAEKLSHEAEMLVWFLYRRHRANISELATAMGTDNHMEVLNKIRLEINPASQEIIGRPIFIFRQKWNGIAYNWWLTELSSEGEPFHDIIDEGDFYRVIAETPEDAEVVVKNGKLAFAAKLGFKNTIELPRDAKGICGDRHYRNGILEIRLDK